jgi:hypothetical protein
LDLPFLSKGALHAFMTGLGLHTDVCVL